MAQLAKESANQIIWTKVDEAPQLASYSLLPMVKRILETASISLITKDISLAGRILAQFSDQLLASQQVSDDLEELGQLTLDPNANIIKLPNISASVPQLKAAIAELQQAGYAIPDYPEAIVSEEDREVAAKYAKVLGSAVNPVLRQGNSDRRAPSSVKKYAQSHPHRMTDWNPDTLARVASMTGGDFYSHEESTVISQDDKLSIEYQLENGDNAASKILAEVEVKAGEIVDATFMSVADLCQFYAEQIEIAKQQDLLLSLHLKATMMKASDPVMFGHCVVEFLRPVFDKYADLFAEINLNPNLGLASIYQQINDLPKDQAQQVLADIDACLADRPGLAQVDSDNGITNLHAPNLVIIDASMPVMIRDGGQMWNAQGQLQPALALIPDRSYASVYQAVIDDCKTNGKLDPVTMGSVSNVGLMAQKAEEYGSHATTFIIEDDGKVVVKDSAGNQLFSQQVAKGDIWRMSRVRDIAVRDWVKLALTRAKATGNPAVFFLDQARGHDAKLIEKVNRYLAEYAETELAGATVEILPPGQATKRCLERIRLGQDTISVTGNVLRDYLTDLFPILEVGTSAKMLSIVPLLAGGGLYETGAGGSAPKHVQQFLAENYLRWDSLGEFMALTVSLEQVFSHSGNAKAKVLADCLDLAVGRYLEENRSPARRLGSIDNRGSHYHLVKYWAQELAAQQQDEQLAQKFAEVASQLEANQEQINAELISVQGKPVDLGGYYRLDEDKVNAAMRPSQTLNKIIDTI